MSFGRKKLGQAGEDRAARHLEKQGYRILERNYRASYGEIDLIAMHRGELVFVEVKTRRSGAFGAPELAVNLPKQARMVKAALAYIRYKNLHQVPCRFDVVAINVENEKGIEVIPNAFEMDRTGM